MPTLNNRLVILEACLNIGPRPWRADDFAKWEAGLLADERDALLLQVDAELVEWEARRNEKPS